MKDVHDGKELVSVLTRAMQKKPQRVERLNRGDLRLYDQANKRTRWMPRQSEAKKDVAACEKCRGVGNKH